MEAEVVLSSLSVRAFFGIRNLDGGLASKIEYQGLLS
jgi:hypothetical protein